MSRLIDADVLLEAIKDYPYGYRGMIESTISEQQTIEPEQNCEKCVFRPFKQFQPERKKGRWVELVDLTGKAFKINEHTVYECSICRTYMLGTEGENAVKFPFLMPMNFCPNCGCDMRSEVNK